MLSKQRYVGVAEHRSLFMSLLEKTNDLVEAGLGSHSLGFDLLDVLGRNQVEDDRHESGVLDSFVMTRWIVNRDARPQNLPRFEFAAGRVEALVELVDLLGEQPTDRGTEDSRELDVQEMAQMQRF